MEFVKHGSHYKENERALVVNDVDLSKVDYKENERSTGGKWCGFVKGGLQGTWKKEREA